MTRPSIIQSTYTNPAAPLRVVIGKQGSNWHEDIHPGDLNDMTNRRNAHDTDYKNHWNSRNGQHGAPRYARGTAHHIPVTAFAGEFVQFQCAVKFMVVLQADPEVDPAGAAQNPVDGANLNQPFFAAATFNTALNLWIVNVKVSSGVGAQNQIFYKMLFIVQDGEPQLVDPDFDTP